MACPLGIRLPKRRSKHRCQAEPRESGQQHKNEKLFFKNLIFQKISIDVVIITFSEFLMVVYGLGFFFFFFFFWMRITSWEVDLPAESVIGLEPLNYPRTPCSVG